MEEQSKYKKVTEAMREQLRAPLPPEAVTKHPTKTYLSSIKAIYVFERLNDVFGIGSYKITSKEISCDNGFPVVKVRLRIPEYGIDLTSYGGNDNGGANSKNYDLGDAYKGAMTDATTKICSWLEIGLSVFKGQGNAPQPNKSNTKPQQSKAPEQAKTEAKEQPKQMTSAQRTTIDNILKSNKVPTELVEKTKAWLNSGKPILLESASAMIQKLNAAKQA